MRLTIAVNDATNEACVDCLPATLTLYQLEHGVGDLLVEGLEQVVSPRHQGQLSTQTHVTRANCQHKHMCPGPSVNTSDQGQVSTQTYVTRANCQHKHM